SMLYQVFAKGPFMQGIFRKSANARLVRELRDKLDTGEEVTWEHVPVLVTGSFAQRFFTFITRAFANDRFVSAMEIRSRSS
ncbi:hypothetical protein U1Q18_048844, partial [Sarracenia purpurea var. burkii]